MAFLMLEIKKTLKFVSAIFLLFLIFSCGGSNRHSQLAHSPDVYTYSGIEQEYRIHVGDKLDIKFFYNPELNEIITVRPDGRIALQLVHEIIAAGMTPEELTNLLKDKYSLEIKNPEITVIVRSFSSQSIHVGGEVSKPGILDLIGPMTVFQALTRAGGLKDTSRLDEIIVIRRSADNKPVIISVNLKKMIDGTDMRQDIILMPYDIVYVPKSPIANINQWVGQYIRNNIPIPISIHYDHNVD